VVEANGVAAKARRVNFKRAPCLAYACASPALVVVSPSSALTDGNLSCAAWSTENGPGVLAAGFLIEEYPEAGDTANINLLDD